MSYVLIVFFITSLCIYLGIANKDIRYHYSLDGTENAVSQGESVLHFMAGTLVTSILVLLIFGNLISVPVEIRKVLLSILPIGLMIVGLVDEFAFHRPRCKNDPLENWHHAVLHFSMGSTLVLGYVRWY